MATTQTGTAKKCHQTLTHMALAGTYTGFITPVPILGAKGEEIGAITDSSLKFSGNVEERAIFGTEVSTEAAVNANGEYFINYDTGAFKVQSGGRGFPRLTWLTKVIAGG